MPSGLVVYNSNGRVQIDSDTPTYFLIKSGSLPLTSVTVAAVHPICAVRGNKVAIRSQTNNGNGTWTIIFLGAENQSGTYYIYDMNLPTAGTNFGIVLYNAAGQMTYTSAQYPMPVVASGRILDGDAGLMNTPNLVIGGLNSSRLYAAFYFHTRSNVQRVELSPSVFGFASYLDCVTTNPTSVVVSFELVNISLAPAVPYSPRGGFCTVIDVTNVPTNFSL